MKNYKVISLITLLVLLVLGGAAAGFFFICLRHGISVGGFDVAGEYTSIPMGTSTYLGWIYLLIAIASVIAIISVCWILYVLFKTHPGRAIAILSVIASVPLTFSICLLLASPEQVNILGFEGGGVAGFAARLSEACLYETYLYVTVAFAVLVWAVVHFIKGGIFRVIK